MLVKSKAKKLVTLLFTAVMAFSVIGCGDSGTGKKAAATNGTDKDYTFKLANVNNPKHPYTIGCNKFAELVKKGTDGHVTIEIYDSGTLGNENDIIEQVQMGSIQFGLVASAPFANTIPEMYVFDLPFLFANRPAAYKVLDGDIGKNILAKLDSQNMIGLGWWENGFRHVSNSKHKVVVPADLKGLKIRTMENKIHMASFNAMGAIATPMAWSEVFTALQQGTMDGLENSPVIYATNAFYEVQKYLSLTGHFYSPSVFFCNKETFKSLPEKYQKVILSAEKEARDFERKTHEDLDNSSIKVLKDHGMEITEVDKAVWRKSCESVYKENRDKIGGKLIDDILSVK